MKPRLRSSHVVVVVLSALWSVAVAAQGTPPVEPPTPSPAPRSGAQGGVGVQVDLGALWRSLASRRSADRDQAYHPGQIVGVWEAEAGVALSDLTAATGARVREAQPLAALGLTGVVLELPQARVEAALRVLRQRYPAATFGRHAVYAPAAGSPAADGAAVQYARRLIRAPAVSERLSVPVRIGIVDGLPDPAAPLEGVQRLPLVAAPAGTEHATAVACVLACAPETGTPGLARGAALLFAAVLVNDAVGRPRSDTFTVARALDALSKQRVDLIHMSLGSAPDPVLARVVERTLPRVRAFIAAGGKATARGEAPFPAALPGVIAVAAVDAEARPWRGGARGRHIAIAAPGVDVWLPVGGGRYVTGTSFAAPFVTAALATRLANAQSADQAALCATAADLPPVGPDPATGCGLLQWPQGGGSGGD